MLERLVIPEEFQRNAPDVKAAGYEHTGETLIRLAMRRAGVASLGNIDILDVGCGVRFTSTIVNRRIPIKSYTGVEVNKPIVDFLRENVTIHDSRFRYVHWNVKNDMYNPGGVSMDKIDDLPLLGEYDLIWMFSVFTHLNPADALILLKILRRHIRSRGRLFFSAFIDDALAGFEDRDKDHPLHHAYYGRLFMESLINQAGWHVEGFFEKDVPNFIQASFLCSPAREGILSTIATRLAGLAR